uniref:Uncharacterized protein n=1 Tax=Zooxanthella nutricula TaxID=1333877 RepID=A0A7S2JLB1_9DINO
MESKVQGVKRMLYKITVGDAVPDEVPFIIKFDFNARIICTVFEDLFLLDIDCGPGKDTKFRALAKVQSYASFRGMKFAVWETENGIHAYCLSHPLPWSDHKTRKEMGDVVESTECDEWYFAFAAVRGWSQRLSPKGILTSNMHGANTKRHKRKRSLATAEQISASFVRRRLDGETEGMQVVGPSDVQLHEGLVAKMQLVTHLTEFAIRLCHANPERLQEDGCVDELVRTLTQEAKRQWRSGCPEGVRIPEALWIRSSKASKPNWWTCNHGSQRITVFEKDDGRYRKWKICVASHDDRHPESLEFPPGVYESPKKAKRIAEEAHGSSAKRLKDSPMTSRQQARLHFGDVHAFGDTCFVCGRYGHWAGDPECTTSSFYHRAQGGWC